MSAQEVRQWVEEAGDRASNPSIDDAVYYWAGELTSEHRGPFERWSCDDEKCPARPDWDKRLSELYEQTTAELVDKCTSIVIAGLSKMVRTYLDEYPDAPRRQVDVAA